MSRRTLTYSAFAVVGLMVILMFVTATTYTQLIAAVLLYPLAALFAFQIFVRQTHKATVEAVKEVVEPVIKKAKIEEEVLNRSKVDVVDIDKRTFLKFVGAAGISFFLFSILGRRVDSLLFGRNVNTALTGVGNTGGGPVASQRNPTEGYRISEIDDSEYGFYGFINEEGAWFIMKEDVETGSFRYAKGEANFSTNWKGRHELEYVYFHELF